MRRKNRRPNLIRIVLLLGLIAVLVYVNQAVEPLSPSLFLPSPTPTISPENFIAEAESFAAEGKFALALQAYNRAIIADPQNPANYLASSRLQVYSGNYEEAVKNASNALLLNPDSSQAEALKGIASGMIGEYLDAEASLNRAIELDPSNAFAYAYLSIIYSQKIMLGEDVLGNLDSAIENSHKAQAIAPDALETYWARGMVLEITGNYEEAIIEFEAAITQNRNIAELHLAIGRNYRFLQQYDRAVEEFTRANALNPTDPLPDTYISRTYASVGEFAKAIQYAEQAVADAPDDPYMYGNLGVMYKQNYQLEQAILTLRLAVQGGATPEGIVVEGLPLAYGRIVEYYYNYGLALMELGYCGDAVSIGQAILQSITEDEYAVYNANHILERCFEKMNDLQLLKLPTPTMIPTWTPQPSPTPTPTPLPSPTRAGG
ncbi:MAG TPA: tetratricopeptide repeat protein [Anaerolineae bacterium]|nr:tetratricopeptide repeat protein [Anaerolineae bacterium]